MSGNFTSKYSSHALSFISNYIENVRIGMENYSVLAISLITTFNFVPDDAFYVMLKIYEDFHSVLAAHRSPENKIGFGTVNGPDVAVILPALKLMFPKISFIYCYSKAPAYFFWENGDVITELSLPRQIWPFFSIKVSEVYECENGFSGMKRDVVLTLMSVLGFANERKIREIMGMCQEYLPWRILPRFIRIFTKREIPPLFYSTPNPRKEGYTIMHTSHPEQGASYQTSSTVFLNKILSTGVFQWTVRIAYSKTKDSDFGFGGAPCYLCENCENSFLGEVKDTYCLSFSGREGSPNSLKSTLLGVMFNENIFKREDLIFYHSLVTMEVNTERRKLTFFVDGVQTSRGISDIHVPLRIGMSGRKSATFSSVCFRRLEKATASTATTVYHSVATDKLSSSSDPGHGYGHGHGHGDATNVYTRTPSILHRLHLAMRKEQFADVGISAQPISLANLLEWEAFIRGPPDTPYSGRTYRALLSFPVDFPMNPPVIRFVTPLFHPNVFPDGTVCMSVLRGPCEDPEGIDDIRMRWCAVYSSVDKLLLSFICLLNVPDCERPANVEAASLYLIDRAAFNRRAAHFRIGSV